MIAMNDKEILEKFKMNIAINNLKNEYTNKHTLNQEIEWGKYNLKRRLIAGLCTGFILVSGLVYARTKVAEKIWREPEKVVGFSWEEGKPNKISKEEKMGAMSEEEARKKANELLKKFGHGDEKIKLIQLDNNSSNYELEWYIKTDNDNNRIGFDASGGNEVWLAFDSALNGNIEKYRTTAKEAEKTARDFCKKYGYDLKEYTKVAIRNNLETEEDSYIWYVDFYKEYDGLINSYEAIKVGFVPEINELYYFDVNDSKYENNPTEITEEQAKQKVLEAEEKIKPIYERKNVDVILDIVKMNGDAYARMTDYSQYRKQPKSDSPDECVEYRTEGRIRKAWVVTIEYDIPDDINRFDNSYNPFDRGYSYYVDATTGEIIGGDVWRYIIYYNNESQ